MDPLGPSPILPHPTYTHTRCAIIGSAASPCQGVRACACARSPSGLWSPIRKSTMFRGSSGHYNVISLAIGTLCLCGREVTLRGKAILRQRVPTDVIGATKYVVVSELMSFLDRISLPVSGHVSVFGLVQLGLTYELIKLCKQRCEYPKEPMRQLCVPICVSSSCCH